MLGMIFTMRAIAPRVLIEGTNQRTCGLKLSTVLSLHATTPFSQRQQERLVILKDIPPTLKTHPKGQNYQGNQSRARPAYHSRRIVLLSDVCDILRKLDNISGRVTHLRELSQLIAERG